MTRFTPPNERPHPRNSGFTLVELMIAVAIVAVLASVATVGLRYQAQKARVAQADAMLAAIAAAQAGQDPYIGTTAINYCPGSVGAGSQGWDDTCQTAVWAQLGIATPIETYFQYAVVAGGASANCTHGTDICGTVTAGERWWVAIARGDLDGDGTFSTHLTSYALMGSFVRIDEHE